MLAKSDSTSRERFFFSMLIAFVVHYFIVVILLLAIWKLGGWEKAAAGCIALTGPIVLSQLLYRWTVS